MFYAYFIAVKYTECTNNHANTVESIESVSVCVYRTMPHEHSVFSVITLMRKGVSYRTGTELNRNLTETGFYDSKRVKT